MTDQLATAHLAALVQDRAPTNTILSRSRVLRSLPNAGTATREEVEAWWASRAYLTPATRANDLANLRSFYRWAQLYEHRDDDPTRRIRTPKVPLGVPRPVSRADLRTLIAGFEGDLRRALFLGAFAGLRVSEAAGQDWTNVDVDGRRLRVTGKGSKTRLVPMSAALVDALLPARDAGNVVTAGAAPVTGAVLGRRFQRAAKRLGVDVGFHQLRHRFGTEAYRATGDLVAVARIMGHASITTATIYTLESDDVADVIAEAVSRANA